MNLRERLAVGCTATNSLNCDKSCTPYSRCCIHCLDLKKCVNDYEEPIICSYLKGKKLELFILIGRNDG